MTDDSSDKWALESRSTSRFYGLNDSSTRIRLRDSSYTNDDNKREDVRRGRLLQNRKRLVTSNVQVTNNPVRFSFLFQLNLCHLCFFRMNFSSKL